MPCWTPPSARLVLRTLTEPQKWCGLWGESSCKNNQKHGNKIELLESGGWFRTWILWLSIYRECHHPNWLSYFSEGLKPPTRSILSRLMIVIMLKTFRTEGGGLIWTEWLKKGHLYDCVTVDYGLDMGKLPKAPNIYKQDDRCSGVENSMGVTSLTSPSCLKFPHLPPKNRETMVKSRWNQAALQVYKSLVYHGYVETTSHHPHLFEFVWIIIIVFPHLFTVFHLDIWMVGLILTYIPMSWCKLRSAHKDLTHLKLAPKTSTQDGS